MKVFHGTDKATKRKIISEGRLTGCPTFGPGVCLSRERALNFASIKVQKHLHKGRDYARRQIAILEFEIEEKFFLEFAKPDTMPDVFTFPAFKEIKITA
jgi:hypothetical protein